MTYTATTFVNGTDPAITAAELNKIGAGIATAQATADGAASTVALSVPASTITTRGDLLVGSVTGSVVRLPAGTNGYVLTADSTQSSGLKWTAGSYAKPPGGIPSTDLTSAVQSALALAATAYQKPGGGIPSSDLSASVQSQLASGGGSGAVVTLTQTANPVTGIIIPMYIYPASVFSNTVYNTLMDLKRLYHRVPVYAVINPESGPGTVMDGNYKKAIQRLQGAGIIVLAYVPVGYAPGGATGHTPRTAAAVKADIDTWQTFYPGVNGLFLDEMSNTDNSTSVDYYVDLLDYAHTHGLFPVVGNPGTAVPSRYFNTLTADCIIVHENNTYPSESNLKGDYDGGYIDTPYWRRGSLVFSQGGFDATQFAMLTKYLGMVYVTEANASWGTISTYMTNMLDALSAVTLSTGGGGGGGGGTTSDGTVTSTVGDLV